MLAEPRLKLRLLQAGVLMLPLLVDAQPVGPSTGGRLEEVVVTAQRREEVITDVPISMTVLSADSLSSAGINSTGDLGKIVPGLSMDMNGPFSQPTMRGIGSSVTGPGIGTSVATYIDGYYQPSTVTNVFELADVSSIQVLKGPQGTLFGRNSTAGAILVTTMTPSFEPMGRARFSYGRFNDTRASMVFSSGLTDTVAAYVAAHYHDTDGASKNLLTGRHDQSAQEQIYRMKVLWQATEDLSVTLAYAHADVSNPYGVAQTAYKGISAAANLPGAVIPSGRDTATTINPATDIRYDSATLSIEYDLGGALLKSSTGWRNERAFAALDSDKSNAQFQWINFEPHDRTISQEFNLSGDSERLEWVTGLFYYRDRSGYNNFILAQEEAPPFKFMDARAEVDAISLFGDATYQLSDNLFLTGGLRYNHERSEGIFAAITNNYQKVSADKTFESVTPRVVLRYTPNAWSSVYFSASQGYKAGTFNPLGLSTEPVDPEEVTAYEVGYKVAGDSTRFEAAVYYYDYKDLQFVSYVGPTAQLTNAASATIYGFDAQLTQSLTESLQLDIGLAYTDAEYDSFPGANRYFYSPANGISNAPDDASGNRMVRTPKAVVRAALDYSHPLAGGMARANLAYYYQTGQYFDAFEEIEQDAYGLLNATLAWTDPSDTWTVGLYGRNLTNEKYLTQVNQQSESFPQTWGDPVSYGVEVSLQF